VSNLVCRALPLLTYAHVFRHDRVNHVVVTAKVKVRRNGRHRVLCGPRVDETFQRRVSTGTVASPVTCDKCLKSMTGIVDLMERAERNL
jgi:hypothetical protein